MPGTGCLSVVNGTRVGSPGGEEVLSNALAPGGGSQRWSEPLARTKADPESDDDEILRVALEAERGSTLVSSTGTDSAEDDLTYTESNWAVHKGRRSWRSTLLYSSTTPIDEAHSSFQQEG